MPGLERRLNAIEAVTGPCGPWTANELGMLAWMSEPSLAVVIAQEAAEKAQRRWLHEHDKIAGRPTSPDGRGWTMTARDGWLWHTSETERAELTRREHGDLQLLLRRVPLHAAVRVWLAEAEEHGWPSLHPDGYADAFADKLARHRAMMVVHRGGKDLIAAAWRRRNPGWRETLTPDEADAWDLALLEKESTP